MFGIIPPDAEDVLARARDRRQQFDGGEWHDCFVWRTLDHICQRLERLIAARNQRQHATGRARQVAHSKAVRRQRHIHNLLAPHDAQPLIATATKCCYTHQMLHHQTTHACYAIVTRLADFRARRWYPPCYYPCLALPSLELLSAANYARRRCRAADRSQNLRGAGHGEACGSLAGASPQTL